MKINNRNTKQSGFSLLELIVVLAVLGILASIVLPSAFSGTSKASALLKMRTADTLKTCILNVHANLGWGSNVLSNPNYNSGNDGLDMCVGGDVAINKATLTALIYLVYQTWFKLQQHQRMAQKGFIRWVHL